MRGVLVAFVVAWMVSSFLVRDVLAGTVYPPGKLVGHVDAKTYEWVQHMLGYTRACAKLGCKAPEIRTAEMHDSEIPNTRVVAYFSHQYPNVIFISPDIHAFLVSNNSDLFRRGWSTVLHETVHQLRYTIGLSRSPLRGDCDAMREEQDAYLLEMLFRQRFPYAYDHGLRDVWAGPIVEDCVKSDRY